MFEGDSYVAYMSQLRTAARATHWCPSDPKHVDLGHAVLARGAAHWHPDEALFMVSHSKTLMKQDSLNNQFQSWRLWSRLAGANSWLSQRISRFCSYKLRWCLPLLCFWKSIILTEASRMLFGLFLILLQCPVWSPILQLNSHPLVFAECLHSGEQGGSRERTLLVRQLFHQHCVPRFRNRCRCCGDKHRLGMGSVGVKGGAQNRKIGTSNSNGSMQAAVFD